LEIARNNVRGTFGVTDLKTIIELKRAKKEVNGERGKRGRHRGPERNGNMGTRNRDMAKESEGRNRNKQEVRVPKEI